MRPTLSSISSAFSNPVVVRDMRIRMRGTRAYWNQALYLAVVSVVAIMGYASSTSFEGLNLDDPVSIQFKLQQFYYWIFEGLAVLITLIAPALTAVSIISEKKMQTLDLLVTTPMSSMQMLVGKLISSVAFILLLLILSIPASALCVILGGATIADVLQSYFLLMVSGLLMAAIGLAASCSAKQHIDAIAKTYGSVFLLLVCSSAFGASAMSMMFSRMIGSSSTSAPAAAAMFELNPFFATAYPSFSISLFGLSIPVWLATCILCIVLVRIILTSAAIELGTYGTNLTASLRRQILTVTGLLTFLTAQSITSSVPHPANPVSFVIVVSVIFGLSIFFLPKLFVPTVDEDGPIGQSVVASYSLKNSFGHTHAGSLPFFQIWLFCIVCCCVLGTISPSGSSMFGAYSTYLSRETGSVPVLAVLENAAYITFYLSGLGFLLWSLARRAATWSNNPQPARLVTFLLFAFLVAAPLMVLIIDQSTNPYQTDPIRFVWLLYPYTDFDDKLGAFPWLPFYGYGLVAYVLGLVIYPITAKVIPGARSMPSTSPPKKQRAS